jgi:hypothetical protein
MAANPGGGSGIRTTPNVRELARQLRSAGGGKGFGAELAKEFRKANLWLAGQVSSEARGRAAQGEAIERKAANSIKARATGRGARIEVTTGTKRKAVAMGPVAFWGAKRFTGWMAGRADPVDPTVRQHRPWVGADWQVGKRGEGPYVLNETIGDIVPDVIEEYWERVDAAFASVWDASSDVRAEAQRRKALPKPPKTAEQKAKEQLRKLPKPPKPPAS